MFELNARSLSIQLHQRVNPQFVEARSSIRTLNARAALPPRVVDYLDGAWLKTSEWPQPLENGIGHNDLAVEARPGEIAYLAGPELARDLQRLRSRLA